LHIIDGIQENIRI